MSRAPLTVLVLLGMGVLALVLVGHGWLVPVSFFTPVSVVVSALSVVLVLWERWIWRIRFLHPWPVRQPDLNGTWRGVIRRAEGAPIDIFLVIDQTSSSIAYRTFTAESRSSSVTASLTKMDGQFLLAALYRNEPGLIAQERSRIHYGALWVWVHDPPGAGLDGKYWTDRDTKGEIRFERVSTRLASSYEQARASADAARAIKPARAAA